MRHSSLPWNANRFKWLSFSLLVGILVSMVFLYAMRYLELKWLACLFFGSGVLGLTLLSGKFERFMLIFIFLLIPVNVDFNLHFTDSIETIYLSSGVPRIGLSMIDCLLFFLYAAWIWRFLTNPERRQIVFPSAMIFILGFMAWGSLSMINAKSWFVSTFMLFSFFKAALLLFYMVNHLRTRDDYLLLVKCLIVGLFLESCIGFLQQLKGGNLGLSILGERKVVKEMSMTGSTVFRIGGTLGHPNYLGGYLTAVLPFVFSAILGFLHKKISWISIGVFLMGFTVLILCYSRSAWVMVFVALVFLFFQFLKNSGKAISKGSIVAVFAVLAFVFAAFSPVIIARMSADDRGSTSSRIPQTKVALSMIRAHPILGVGMNNYTLVTHLHEQYVENPQAKTRVELFHGPVHNMYLGYVAETGLIGLLWLGGFMWLVISRGWKKMKLESDHVTKFLLLGIWVGFCARIPHDGFHTGNLAANPLFWIYAACLVSPPIKGQHVTVK